VKCKEYGGYFKASQGTFRPPTIDVQVRCHACSNLCEAYC
jgi:hypothetical protein